MEIKNIEVFSMEYEPGGPACAYSGYRRGKRPKGAVAGGNGTYVVKGAPPKIILETTIGDIDIYYAVKNIIAGAGLNRRVTKKLANDMSSYIKDELGGILALDKNGEIKDLFEIVEKCIQ